MPVTGDQYKLIESALRALDITPHGQQNLAADVQAGMSKFVSLFNSTLKTGQPKLEFKPEIGYTPELGARLLAAMKAADFSAIKGAYAAPLVGGESTAKTVLSMSSSYSILPQAIKDHPKIMIDLVDNADALIGALNQAYKEGLLSKVAPTTSAPTVKKAAPVSTPSGGRSGTAGVSNSPPGAVVPKADTPVDPQVKQNPEEQTPEAASYVAETVLAGIIPVLKQKGVNIEMPDAPDSVFDEQSNKRLQLILEVVTGPFGMKIAADGWEYTPALRDKIKAAYPDYRAAQSPADQAKMPESIDPFLKALDTLKKNEKLEKKRLVEPFSPISGMQNKLLTGLVGIILKIFPGAHDLLGSILNSFGINIDTIAPPGAVMTTGNTRGADSASGDMPPPPEELTRDQRLENAYKSAIGQGDASKVQAVLVDFVGSIAGGLDVGTPERRNAANAAYKEAFEKAGVVLNGVDKTTPEYATKLDEAAKVYVQTIIPKLDQLDKDFPLTLASRPVPQEIPRRGPSGKQVTAQELISLNEHIQAKADAEATMQTRPFITRTGTVDTRILISYYSKETEQQYIAAGKRIDAIRDKLLKDLQDRNNDIKNAQKSGGTVPAKLLTQTERLKNEIDLVVQGKGQATELTQRRAELKENIYRTVDITDAMKAVAAGEKNTERTRPLDEAARAYDHLRETSILKGFIDRKAYDAHPASDVLPELRYKFNAASGGEDPKPVVNADAKLRQMKDGGGEMTGNNQQKAPVDNVVGVAPNALPPWQ